MQMNTKQENLPIPGKGFLWYQIRMKQYCVTTGNAINNEKIQGMKEMIEQINEMGMRI